MNPFHVSPSDSVFQSALAVVPSDGTQLTPPAGPLRATRGILVGGPGNMTVIMADGTTVLLTIPATACGTILPIAANFVKSTGTTATLMVAFW